MVPVHLVIRDLMDILKKGAPHDPVYALEVVEDVQAGLLNSLRQEGLELVLGVQGIFKAPIKF